MTKGYSKVLFLTTLFVVLPSSGSASVITLTFEGLQNFETVASYYNGGTGGSGSIGLNYGITFGSSALALSSGNFDQAPTMPTILFFQSGNGAIMNVAGGFDTGFSFYYSSPNQPGSVTVYAGLNGAGTVLQTLALPATPASSSNPACGATWCPFEAFGVSFLGTGLSVNFGGGAGQIAFDNVTLGASIPTGGAAAEPGTWALMVCGLAAVAVGRRRRA